jgi:hypothetical protein
MIPRDYPRKFNPSTPEEFGILLREVIPFLRKIVKREDRRNRANRDTGATIDALHRIDIQHLGVGEFRVFFFRMNAVDGTGVHASRVLRADAGFRDYVCHMSGIFKNTIHPTLADVVRDNTLAARIRPPELLRIRLPPSNSR